jgi:hypothetical protein
MTGLQMAYAHCANWKSDGSCLGAVIDDDLQIRRCCTKPKCLLGTPGVRSRYFEECVAPMAASIENLVARAEFEAAMREYRVAAKLQSADERPCPVCGRAMEPVHRFCEACAAARRRVSTRQAVRRYRIGGKQLSGNGPLEIKGLEGAN